MKTKHPKDALRAARKGSRDAEIGMYGHPIAHHKVHRSKKQYDRKRDKARPGKEDGPFYFALSDPGGSRGASIRLAEIHTGTGASFMFTDTTF